MVIVSGCIEHNSCRWNGLMVASDTVRALKEHVEFRPVCPEVEIGLGVPRKPVRVVRRNPGRVPLGDGRAGGRAARGQLGRVRQRPGAPRRERMRSDLKPLFFRRGNNYDGVHG